MNGLGAAAVNALAQSKRAREGGPAGPAPRYSDRPLPPGFAVNPHLRRVAKVVPLGHAPLKVLDVREPRLLQREGRERRLFSAAAIHDDVAAFVAGELLDFLHEIRRVMRDQKQGSIILLSSIRSVTVEPGQGVYAATKAGIVQMARAMAAEVG
ncbi:SDR family NAD(P)-dependent oxidoreductase, partial [Lacticaseibacillus rhamnosus]